QDQTERFLTRTEGKESDSGNYFGIDKKLDASLYTWRETLPAESIEQIEAVVRHSRIGAKFFDGLQEDRDSPEAPQSAAISAAST
ncbi:MAG: hypothetical protein AAF495_26150, partial [Pseudomonadota bacterium]